MTQPFFYLLRPFALASRNRARQWERTDLTRGVVFGGVALGVCGALVYGSFGLTTQRLDYEEVGDFLLRQGLAGPCRTVRPFLALLGGSASLASASGGAKVMAAVRTLPELAVRKIKSKPLLAAEVDAALVPPVWRRAVYDRPDLHEGAAARAAYGVCVLGQTDTATRMRDEI